MTLNWLAIGAAALAAFVFAAVYYSLLAGRAARYSPAWADGARPQVGPMLLEVVKSLIVAAVVAGLVSLLGITHEIDAILLGLALWIGFPVMLLAGSVIHEKVPWQLAAIHAGDWLAKLLIIAVIVCLWR